MIKMMIINVVIVSLLVYDVILFCRYKGWTGHGSTKAQKDGADNAALPLCSNDGKLLNSKLIAK